MIRCLLVDDEKLALELMEDNLLRVPHLQLQGKCKNVMEAMVFMGKDQVDLMFLDIQMPGISGIQFLNSLANPPVVIIVSAYENYALDGFNLDVADYILKPFSFERFLKAVNKASELINIRQQKEVPTKPVATDYLFVNADYSVVRINIPDILYVEGLKDYVKIYIKNQAKAVITRLSMRFMEEKLPNNGFARVHKSYIVSLDKITAFKKNRLLLGEIEIPVSDNYKDKLLTYMGHTEHDSKIIFKYLYYTPMRKTLLIAALLLITSQLFAQRGGRAGGGRAATPATPTPLAAPVAEREVSGVILDEKDQPVIGATLVLSSKKDTIRLATNADGIFVFKNVQMATFVVSVNSIGYKPFVESFKMNDVLKKLILKPIKLEVDQKTLTEVNINGTPSITYKTDTIEYKASDYHVRENSTVDELLKKMEGFEVGSDGSLTHQGQSITKAKLNGKDYAGGDVAQAIQNLPADIVEKIQVVDDYGDQAARTGIKEGDPQKVLNITTKDDRSVGTTGRLTAQAGNNDRYNAQLFVQHINANEQLGVIGNFRNTVTGVASTGVQGGATNGGGGGAGVGAGARGGGSPGTSQSGSPSLNYRDQWSKKVQVISSYAYTFTNNNSINKSYGQRYTSLGPDNFTNDNTSQRNSDGHTVHFEMDVDLNKTNYLQITPTFTYNNATSATTLSQDDIENYSTGFVHQFQTGTSSTLSTTTNYGITAFYLHVFQKPHRNFSIQVALTHNTQQSNGGNNKDYKYYADSTKNVLIKDSTANLLTPRTNKTFGVHTTVTYVEPLSLISQIEFRGDINRSNNNSTSIQDSVLANGQIKDLTALDNIYNYTTTQSRATINYRYNGTKVNLTLGATAIPYNLTGTKVDEGVGQNVSTSHSYFRVVPAFRFAYNWSRTERFQIAYSGQNTDPSFQEIQPFTDKSDPKNIKVGNPNLQPGFSNSVTASYNDYISNSRFNLSLNANYTSVDNSITTNVIQIKQPLTVNLTDPSKNTFQNINQTNYINLGGSQSFVGRYNISKQLDDRRYNLALNGNITYNYTPGMSNNILYHQTDWRFDERFGPRISPNDNIEFNPYIGYDVDRNFTTLPGAKPTYYRTIQLAVDGKMYFLQTFQVNYSAHKVFVSGIANSTNPLIINAGFQKEFFKKKNLVFTFDVYDLLHQNNFVQQTVTSTGVTNTISNSLSRYFMFGLRLNLQQWSGRPTRNGRALQRRGDGSFIYE